MLKKFKEYDKRDFGYNDKTKVLESFFDEFPPKYRLPPNYIQDFWNNQSCNYYKRLNSETKS
jgi:putative hydrolase of the HAD superfamily